VLLAAVACLLQSQARAEQPRLPAIKAQKYVIDATLDPVKHVVTATQRVSFVHHAKTPLTALELHLYLNAFRDEGTVFMREGGDELRGEPLTRPGRIELLELRDELGNDLLAKADDQRIKGDRTQLHVPLPSPLAAGVPHELHMRFVATLPSIVARSGFAGDFHMVAQWFPKLARLMPDGRFVTFPYHGMGEFYADFADYRLRLRVPQRFVVGATGVCMATSTRDGYRTDTFVANSVHDIAFAAYPHFDALTSTHGETQLELLVPRGYGPAARRQLYVLRAALDHFQRRYGVYPYRKLTVVVPPAGAGGAAGMEYPTLFTSAGPWFALPHGLPDVRHDALVAHELAHQWFGGMLASNEVEEPVLDEGLAEWATLDFLNAFYSRDTMWLSRVAHGALVFDVARELFQRGGPAPSSLLPAYRYRPDSLARAVYLRPALVLHDLERSHGRARLDAALAHYTRTQRFAHPTREALLAAFDHAYGAGFGQRVLVPALRGDQPRPRTTTKAPSLFADLLLVAQSVLRGIGP
jgi:hypothetical protein